MKKMRNIPFSPPDISELEIRNVIETLRSGWITTGPRTKELEKRLSEYLGTEKTVTMNSATACMEMTLRALEIGPGDEVITSVYTYTASASVIDHVGAKVVLIDTGKNSFHLDYDQLAQVITNKTKAIIPVDIGGTVVDYEKIYEILETKKSLFSPKKGSLQEKFDRVIVIADAAHSLGASRGNKLVGQLADFTSFSFHAVKNFTTGEGGALTWNSRFGIDNEDLYSTFTRLILHGQTKDALSKNRAGAWEYDIVAPYYKANLTDINAAIGLGQLDRYDSLLEKRKRIIEKYNSAFEELPVSYLPHFTSEYTSSGHLYLLRINEYSELDRNNLIQKLADIGISTNVHYKPLPLLSAYKNLGFDISDYPNAYNMYKNEISLPLNTKMSMADVEYITSALKEIL